MWKFVAPLVLVVLTACGGGARNGGGTPVVPAYYGGTPGETVQVQVQTYRDGNPAAAHARAQATADQVCGRRNQRAEYNMHRDMMNQNRQDVFMCR